MQAKAWHNGDGTYGISVGASNRDEHFAPKWRMIQVEIDGRFHQFELTSGFWRKCPEFRDRGEPIIRAWLARHRLLDWPLRHPPTVELIPLGNGKFRLTI